MARAPRKNKPEAEDFSGYLEKGPTDLQARFTDWLKGDAVGYNPASAKTKAEAFAEGVRLSTALRMKFQASPENQELLEERRAAKEAQEHKPKPKRKTRKAKAQEEPEPEEIEEDEDPEEDDEEEPEPEEEPEEDDEEEEEPEEEPKPKPARRTRAAAKTKTAATGTRTRRTRAAAKKADPAPF